MKELHITYWNKKPGVQDNALCGVGGLTVHNHTKFWIWSDQINTHIQPKHTTLCEDCYLLLAVRSL